MVFGTRYDLEILHQYGKRIFVAFRKLLWLIPMFAENTGEKLFGQKLFFPLSTQLSNFSRKQAQQSKRT